LEDGGVDGVMVILPPPPMTTAAEVAGAIIPVIRSSEKPVVVTLMGEELIAHAARLFRQARIPDYRFPERAASAMRVLVRRAQQLAAPASETAADVKRDLDAARQAVEQARVSTNAFVLAETAQSLASAYHLPSPREGVARSPEEAVQLARGIGFPVALKVLSPDIAHKSDVGAVLLDMRGEEQVREGFGQVVAQVQSAVPQAQVQGVLVQQVVGQGQDVIVGFVHDAQFGPLVMFGQGGVEVEALGDVSFALAPLTRGEAEDMIQRTWAGRRLAGYRNTPPADKDAVVATLLQLSQLALDLPEVVEMEINPLRVFPGEQGALALDIRLRLWGAT
jgi:acetyltransferase